MSQFLCLLPVFNHQQVLTENSVQCFLSQTHKDAFLLIGDDRPRGMQLPYSGIQNVIVYKMDNRAKNLADKYSQMLTHASRIGLDYDAVAIWDDDDIYLPNHLALASACYEAGAQYTWPETIFDKYTDTVELRRTDGLFWASMTVRRAALERVGGFVSNPAVHYDQEIMSRLQNEFGPPARPNGVSFWHRWASTGDVHCSASPAATWYSGAKPTQSTGPLRPAYDADTVASLMTASSLVGV